MMDSQFNPEELNKKKRIKIQFEESVGCPLTLEAGTRLTQCYHTQYRPPSKVCDGCLRTNKHLVKHIGKYGNENSILKMTPQGWQAPVQEFKILE
ncbi:MAG: hypothetical protein Q7S00_03090 [bacterium]|nr:hypothetical protein [bacterium]